MRFLAREIFRDTPMNIMDQYRPCGLAHRYAEIARPITAAEYREAVAAARAEGIHRLDEPHPARILRLFREG